MKSVLEDIQHQIYCLEEDDHGDMWDCNDLCNWQSMLDALLKYKEENDKRH